jgi:hypothetical protein
LLRVKREDEESDNYNDQPTLPLQSQHSLIIPKSEPTLDITAEEDIFSACPPTQELASKETSVVLCATFMSAANKVTFTDATLLLHRLYHLHTPI